MHEITLNNGIKIPQIALGLWKVKDESELERAVLEALEAGYRHFDSAQIYGNEAFLGNALKKSSVAREELFITTKLWNDNQWSGDAIPSFEKSLENLGMEYVDLFLVHFPVTETRKMAWMQMEEIYKSGKAKAIGVSNYTVKHLEELLSWCEVKPAVNQVELHVYLQQPQLIDFCQKHGIVIEAYSPLAHGKGLDNPVLAKIAKAHGKLPAQVMIRWCIERGLVALPKSVTPERIHENIAVFDFELTLEQMREIEELDSDLRTCWDPTNVA
jgi:diketogulonate reductase-like aldo/keto reductase